MRMYENVNEGHCHYLQLSRMVSHINAVRILLCALSILLCIQWLEAFAVELNSENGRKLLSRGLQGDAAYHAAHTHDRGSSRGFSFSPKIAAMAVPGMLIVGWFLICPCIQRKKKLSQADAYQREFPSMDSSSFFEANSNLEKVAASPWRHPLPSPSPSRYPPPSPSHLRHPPPSPSHSRHPPPSPSRYGMSPRLDRFGSVHLNFSQIAKATHGFSSTFKIGEGGFGTVYKAQLPAGQWIAVKRAKNVWH